jgi:hypothetical protein
MNAVKLARALRLAAEALEEGATSPIENPRPLPKVRARRMPETPDGPVDELARESAQRALAQNGFVRKASK